MRASGFDRVLNDFYVEPIWVIEQMLDVEPLSGVVWDPAAGTRTIPDTINRLCPHVQTFASDVTPRAPGVERLQFFGSTRKVNTIICNPPYAVAMEWVRQALTLTDDRVIVIARLAFLESVKRREFFRATPLARVWVCSRRPSMPPGGSDVKASGGSIPYGWFVWDHSSAPGATRVHWLG